MQEIISFAPSTKRILPKIRQLKKETLISDVEGVESVPNKKHANKRYTRMCTYQEELTKISQTKEEITNKDNTKNLSWRILSTTLSSSETTKITGTKKEENKSINLKRDFINVNLNKDNDGTFSPLNINPNSTKKRTISISLKRPKPKQQLNILPKGINMTPDIYIAREKSLLTASLILEKEPGFETPQSHTKYEKDLENRKSVFPKLKPTFETAIHQINQKAMQSLSSSTGPEMYYGGFPTKNICESVDKKTKKPKPSTLESESLNNSILASFKENVKNLQAEEFEDNECENSFLNIKTISIEHGKNKYEDIKRNSRKNQVLLDDSELSLASMIKSRGIFGASNEKNPNSAKGENPVKVKVVNLALNLGRSEKLGPRLFPSNMLKDKYSEHTMEEKNIAQINQAILERTNYNGFQTETGLIYLPAKFRMSKDSPKACEEQAFHLKSKKLEKNSTIQKQIKKLDNTSNQQKEFESMVCVHDNKPANECNLHLQDIVNEAVPGTKQKQKAKDRKEVPPCSRISGKSKNLLEKKLLTLYEKGEAFSRWNSYDNQGTINSTPSSDSQRGF